MNDNSESIEVLRQWALSKERQKTPKKQSDRHVDSLDRVRSLQSRSLVGSDEIVGEGQVIEGKSIINANPQTTQDQQPRPSISSDDGEAMRHVFAGFI